MRCQQIQRQRLVACSTGMIGSGKCRRSSKPVKFPFFLDHIFFPISRSDYTCHDLDLLSTVFKVSLYFPQADVRQSRQVLPLFSCYSQHFVLCAGMCAERLQSMMFHCLLLPAWKPCLHRLCCGSQGTLRKMYVYSLGTFALKAQS